MVTDIASEWIEERRSWRDYSAREIEPEKMAALRRCFSEVEAPFGSRPVFEIVDFAGEINRLITYGFIRGARVFVAGKVKPSGMCWEDYGWSLEHIILRATGMGLASCWLGGTFSGGAFAQKLGMEPGEIIPAVTPIGYRTDKRSIRDKAIRAIAGSHQRKPWEDLFFEDAQGTGTLASLRPLPQEGEYANALAMLRLAPSASNRQPWRVVKSRGAFHFYLQRTPGYNLLGTDLQRIDMGIAMFHFAVTLKEAGVKGTFGTDDPHLDLPLEYRVSFQY